MLSISHHSHHACSLDDDLLWIYSRTSCVSACSHYHLPSLLTCGVVLPQQENPDKQLRTDVFDCPTPIPARHLFFCIGDFDIFVHESFPQHELACFVLKPPPPRTQSSTSVSATSSVPASTTTNSFDLSFKDTTASRMQRLVSTCSFMHKLFGTYDRDFGLSFSEIFCGQFNMIFVDDTPEPTLTSFNAVLCKFFFLRFPSYGILEPSFCS